MFNNSCPGQDTATGKFNCQARRRAQGLKHAR
jgi:hypothetical protein